MSHTPLIDRDASLIRGLLDSEPGAMVLVNRAGEIVLIDAETEEPLGVGSHAPMAQRTKMLTPSRFWNDAPRLFSTRSETRRRNNAAACRPESEAAHLRAVVEASHDAIISWDLDGFVLSWNAAAERLFGYSADEARGRTMALLLPTGREHELFELLERVRTGQQVGEFETVRKHKDGTLVDVALTVSPMRDGRGRIVGASVIARDIGARLRYQEQLRVRAEHDFLTGLRNRRRLEEELNEQIHRARRYGEQAMLLLIDIDGFKAVNDTYGHRMGDRLLIAISAAMKDRLRETDTVARLGGDEFAVLVRHADAEQGALIASDLRSVIADCSIRSDDGRELGATACIGFVRIDGCSGDAEEVMVEADRLMYEEKGRRTRVAPRSAQQYEEVSA